MPEDTATTTEDYRDVNRAHWDERAPAHSASPGYKVQQFAEDPTFLSDVVRFDVPRLGDLRGLTGVHLQCHIGTDTISLARLGASMTGLDFSGASIAEARRIAADAGADVAFVEGDVYAAADLVPRGSFDLVFTGIGALCWLPDITRWARVVADLLTPGGRLFLREGHPAMWAVEDSRDDDLLVLRYPYFHQREPLVWDEPGSYVEVDRDLQHTRSMSWNHGFGEIVTALLDAGLQLTMLEEHDSVPWEPLPGQMVKDDELDEWFLKEGRERVPLTYTLQAVKPG
ncbi:class I SAM-dependent methyltransferase [Jatrophihabitans sp. YIM 134969]